MGKGSFSVVQRDLGRADHGQAYEGRMQRPYSMVSLSSLEERGRSRRRSSHSLQVRQRLSTVMEMPKVLKNKYLAHEAMLVLLFTNRTRVPVLVDPLAHWRAWWRILGVGLLVINAAAMGSSAVTRSRIRIYQQRA